METVNALAERIAPAAVLTIHRAVVLRFVTITRVARAAQGLALVLWTRIRLAARQEEFAAGAAVTISRFPGADATTNP